MNRMASSGLKNPIQDLSNTLPSVLGEGPSPPPPAGKCPWGKTSSPANSINVTLPSNLVNFSDIMSEQLATTLQVEEELKGIQGLLQGGGGGLYPEAPTTIPPESMETPSGETCSDQMIASMLQLQFNKEYDEELRRIEQKVNRNSKVSVSLSNYMASPPRAQESSSDEEEDELDGKNWDSFEANERVFANVNQAKAGYVKINNEVTTKHDTTMSGRRNACRVMESLSPSIQTGDGGGFDMKLSNKVFNQLKVYSKSEEDRRSRVHDKSEKSTNEMAIDSKTRLLLYKMVNNGILEKVYGIISTGKESIVIYGTGGGGPVEGNGGYLEIPPECALKVFKTTLNEFRTRDKYIKDDYRFKDRFSKLNPRKIIHLWAEKELHNLTRMGKAKIPCPPVVTLKKHILVLGFIGNDMKPAPKLKEVKFPQDDNDEMLKDAYKQTIEGMKKLYSECNLIHSDLSEYNILWHQNTCYFIDVSQSVEPNHPNALEFLYRDCTNICHFFSKKGLLQIESPESLFTSICGYKLEGVGADIINQIQDYEKNLELLTVSKPEKPYPFDYCWGNEKLKAQIQKPT